MWLALKKHGKNYKLKINDNFCSPLPPPHKSIHACVCTHTCNGSLGRLSLSQLWPISPQRRVSVTPAVLSGDKCTVGNGEIAQIHGQTWVRYMVKLKYMVKIVADICSKSNIWSKFIWANSNTWSNIQIFRFTMYLSLNAHIWSNMQQIYGQNSEDPLT